MYWAVPRSQNEAVNDARKAGKRLMRSDANIGFMGTLQLSDDVGVERQIPKRGARNLRIKALENRWKTLLNTCSTTRSHARLYGFVEKRNTTRWQHAYVGRYDARYNVHDLDLNAS